MLKVYDNRFRFMLLPIVIIILGIIFGVFRGGFNMDTEFTGGTRLLVNMQQKFNNEEVAKLIKEKTGISTVVQSSGTATEAIIKFKDADNQNNSDKVYSVLKTQYNLKAAKPLEVGVLSPSFGAGMQKSALLCVAWASILMLLYIMFRFEWRSAFVAILVLLSDILCMVALYLMFNLPINSSFVAAVLTILGYCINDIIIVFDRIRENRASKLNRKKSEPEIAEASIWQTITRSINTSATVIITLVILYIMGVASIKEFALPIIIGVLIGTYSSIFIAAPMWAWWKDSAEKQQKELARAK